MSSSTPISLGVNYAGADEPFKQDYAPATPMNQAKQEALTFFGLAETVDAAGNQTVYNFRKGNDPVDLAQTIGEVADKQRHLQLRLIREVIAGWTMSRPR